MLRILGRLLHRALLLLSSSTLFRKKKNIRRHCLHHAFDFTPESTFSSAPKMRDTLNREAVQSRFISATSLPHFYCADPICMTVRCASDVGNISSFVVRSSWRFFHIPGPAPSSNKATVNSSRTHVHALAKRKNMNSEEFYCQSHQARAAHREALKRIFTRFRSSYSPS